MAKKSSATKTLAVKLLAGSSDTEFRIREHPDFKGTIEFHYRSVGDKPWSFICELDSEDGLALTEALRTVSEAVE